MEAMKCTFYTNIVVSNLMEGFDLELLGKCLNLHTYTVLCVQYICMYDKVELLTLLPKDYQKTNDSLRNSMRLN